MLDCQLFGLKPGAHHLVNISFHCANSAFLFLLLRVMTGAFWRSAFVAALFAWHPLRVESVAWISERKDVLSGFFFMLTLLAWAKYVHLAKLSANAGVRAPARPVPDPKFRSSAWLSSPSFFYFLALTLFILGLLSKPMLVTVPFVLLLLDYW